MIERTGREEEKLLAAGVIFYLNKTLVAWIKIAWGSILPPNLIRRTLLVKRQSRSNWIESMTGMGQLLSWNGSVPPLGSF